MKAIKIILYALLLGFITCGCANDLDTYHTYSFDLVTMPVPKKLAQRETIEIRCQLVKEGVYEKTEFFIRYFQPDGKGELKMEDGTIFLPNDLYPLTEETFRLYYTSHCADQQTIDVYVEDSFGQVVQKTFSFQNDSGTDDD